MGVLEEETAGRAEGLIEAAEYAEKINQEYKEEGLKKLIRYCLDKSHKLLLMLEHKS